MTGYCERQLYCGESSEFDEVTQYAVSLVDDNNFEILTNSELVD